MKKEFIVVIVSVLLSGVAAYCVASTKLDSFDVPEIEYVDAQGKYRTVNLSETDYPDLTFAAETSVDAVVYVSVTMKQNRQNLQIDPFFRFFFGDEYSQPQSREQQASGSGVIIREDGYIVTNNHVVDQATKITVTLNNHQEYEASVVGTDPVTDIAIIKIDAENLPIIPLGDSDNLRLGEWVLAIGSPLSLQSTITAGIVSAKGRSMPNTSGDFKIESFIQTDAAVNPGNSGGALVNKKGELVGINTAIISQTGSYTGYSFAVPVNIVKNVASDLMDFGTVKRALLGITMTPVTEKIAKDLKLSSRNGVYIVEVSKGGAADLAGLKEEDVIVEIDGVKIIDGASVQEKVSQYHPGDKAVIRYIRDGKTNDVEVTFQGVAATNGTVDSEGAVAFYGARLKKADPERLRVLGLSSGVEIVSVGPGKIKDQGVEAGYIITYVNSEKVSKPEDVINNAAKQRRAVFIEGVDASGRASYFGFGKE